MDWRNLLEVSLGLALLISAVLVPPFLLARIFRWVWKRWKPESEPGYLFVYTASLVVWLPLLGLALLMLIMPYGQRAAPPLPVPAPDMPAFPWPPPLASAETMIPQNWLATTGADRLADVAYRLERALKAAKYPRWSYSTVPHGFALVSQMEQIQANGTPSPEPARWSTDLPWVANMTLLEFIKALANAQPAYYRVIVFIVTDQPWSRTGKRPTGEEAERWLPEGFNWLPRSIGELTYGPDYRTTALVYEFKKISRDTAATFLERSPTSADDHLKKAGITDPLSGR